MAIALEGRIEWRMTATYHVQIHLDQKTHLTVPGIVSLQGKVVRVFRSDGQLKYGDRVGFNIWVCQPGDEPTGPAFVYYENFMQASHVEVYLHGKPPNCELAAYELALISAPTDQASMTVAQLQELAHAPVRTESHYVQQTKSWWQRMFRRQQ